MTTQADKAREFLACTGQASPSCCRIHGTSGRPGCSRRSPSRPWPPRVPVSRPPWVALTLSKPGGSAGARRGHGRGHGSARVRRPGECLRGRARRRRGDHEAGDRCRPGRRIGGRLHRAGRGNLSTPPSSPPSALRRRPKSRTRALSPSCSPPAREFPVRPPGPGDTIARLQAYAEAGADVLFAPGLRSLQDIRQVIREVDRPVNVLALEGAPPVPALAEAGVSRVSVGGSFAFAALGALVAPPPNCATTAPTASRRPARWAGQPSAARSASSFPNEPSRVRQVGCHPGRAALVSGRRHYTCVTRRRRSTPGGRGPRRSSTWR